MTSSAPRLLLIFAATMASAVFGIVVLLDADARWQARLSEVTAQARVQVESFRGNLEKHRQGAVLIARHPDMVELFLAPDQGRGQLRARQLKALTDIDYLHLVQLNGDMVLSIPSHAEISMSDPRLAEALSFARAGSLGRAIFNDEYSFIAPVFADGDVVGLALSGFSLDEATAAFDLSPNEIRLFDLRGNLLFANAAIGAGPDVLEVPLNELGVILKARPAQALRVLDWAGRGLVVGLLTFALVYFVGQLFLRRQRLEREADERRKQALILEHMVRERTAELEAAQASVVQAGKLALLGQVAASISHEVNQPLGAIRNYGENAREFLARGMTEQADQNLGHITRQADRMARIVGNLRSFVTGQGGAVKAIDLSPSVDEAVSALVSRFPLAENHLSVPSLEGVRVVAGAVRLEQVLYNLLINAWLAVRHLDRPLIQISLQPSTPERINLLVEDNGPGVPDALQEGLFEAFVGARPESEGLGLGLAIAQQFMETMGGALRLERRRHGAGACFVLELPAAAVETGLIEDGAQ